MKYILTQSQLNAQSSLSLSNNCLIEKSIRSGKTLTLLDYIKNNKFKKVLWVVPDAEIRDNKLPDEAKKWKISFKNITPICYQSIHKYKNTKWDLIILDEVQKLSLTNYNDISTMTYNKLIAMTGTVPNNYLKKELLFDKLKLTVVYKFTVDDAVNSGDVSPYKINILEQPLDSKKNIKVEYTDKKTKQKKVFYTSESDSYDYISYKLDLASGLNKKMLGLRRMRILNEFNSKINFIKNYIAKNSNKRLLIFVSNQKMAEECSKYIYHSKTDSTWYDKFQNKEINHLVLVEKGATGHTYKDLDGCLLTAINSENTIQQKIFRTILFRPNYVANIDVLISKDTIQKPWILNAFKNLDPKNININDT